MTDSSITAIAAGIATVVAAIGTVIATLINAKLNKVEKKTDTIVEKAAAIHSLADGNLSKVSAALGVANEKIDGLQKLVTSLTEEKEATAAQTENVLVAAVTKAPANVTPPAVSKPT